MGRAGEILDAGALRSETRGTSVRGKGGKNGPL